MAGKRADMVAFSSAGPASAGATGGQTDVRNEIYRESGVDTAEADAGLSRIIARVQRTWPAAGLGRVVLPIGYFANVIELDGVGLALCTDGVGSKTIIADMMGKYDTIGIDCVAMNVNDMICVGAKPLSMVDYIAVASTDAAMLDAVAQGLCAGAEIAGISISGGETAQLKDLVKHFDLVGMAVGRVPLDKVIDGRHLPERLRVAGVEDARLIAAQKSLVRRECVQPFAGLHLATSSRYATGALGAGMAPSCCSICSCSMTCQCSAILPPRRRWMSTPEIVTVRPLGGMPMNSPWWVPVLVQ